MPPYDGDEPNAQGEYQQEEEEEPPRDKEEGGAKDDDVEWRLDYHLQDADDVPLDIGEVVRHAADKVATAVVAKVGYGKDGDLMVEVVAQALNKTIAQQVEVDGGEVAEEVAHK